MRSDIKTSTPEPAPQAKSSKSNITRIAASTTSIQHLLLLQVALIPAAFQHLMAGSATHSVGDPMGS
jgi:hypothetical protein